MGLIIVSSEITLLIPLKMPILESMLEFPIKVPFVKPIVIMCNMYKFVCCRSLSNATLVKHTSVFEPAD